MKNILILVIVIIQLVSCGSESSKQAPSSETPNSNIGEKKTITEEINKDTTAFNLNSIPNFKESLLLKIQQYIISTNVLESQRSNVVITSTSMNNDCSKMELTYNIKHENTWWSENGEVNTTLIDKSEFDIAIDILEATEQIAKVKLNINKQYLESELNYYGEKSETSSNVTFSANKTFDLLSKMDFSENKISTLFNAIRGRKVKRVELLNFSLDELSYLRNEFYARKGYQFNTEKMQNYFSKQNWYTPTQSSLTNLLDKTELSNVFYIKAMETELQMSASVDLKTQLSYIYQNAQTKKLDNSDLKDLTAHKLNYLRNEFYARKGYIFKSVRLAEYFLSTNWYKPELENVDDLLSDLDKQNIQFIKSVEKSKQ